MIFATRARPGAHVTALAGDICVLRAGVLVQRRLHQGPGLAPTRRRERELVAAGARLRPGEPGAACQRVRRGLGRARRRGGPDRAAREVAGDAGDAVVGGPARRRAGRVGVRRVTALAKRLRLAGEGAGEGRVGERVAVQRGAPLGRLLGVAQLAGPVERLGAAWRPHQAGRAAARGGGDRGVRIAGGEQPQRRRSPRGRAHPGGLTPAAACCTAANALCSGVSSWFVRFIETCTSP